MELTTQEFRRAMCTDGVLTDKRREFLIELASSPLRSATANQLAPILGYDKAVNVNSIIGGLGKSVAKALDINIDDIGHQWWSIIALGFEEPDGFYWKLRDNLYDALQELQILPEAETTESDEGVWENEKYTEGHSTRVVVNRYERNIKARSECIKHYGVACQVCGLDFESRYGSEIGSGYIHVHHLVELASIGHEYEIDPIADLRPICPNCHSMIHRKTPPYTLAEITGLLRAE